MESLSAFTARQLDCWPLAARNFAALQSCRRRMVKVPVGETTAPVTLLFNPERVRSTAAKVDAASVAARPCFLCARNRPTEQLVHPGLHDLGYDILVNPYPILSPHYTIVARAHEPQLLPMQAMLTAAERFPDLVFFFNGAQSGASAPDHLHFQAVAKRDLPLILRTENLHIPDIGSEVVNAILGIAHPAAFHSKISPSDFYGCTMAHPYSSQLLNTFIFKREDGLMQELHFPRLRHRASSYPAPMVSPGALDVAGLLVTVREKDFDTLTPEIIAQIYRETCPQTLT